jgi:O-antigen ligase
MAGPHRVRRAARPASKASILACVGVCGYLIGIALPFTPAFDLPLAFLVLLGVLAAVTGLTQPSLRRSRTVIAVFGFVAARVASALVAPHASVQFLAPFLPALLLFFLLSEWVEAREHVVAICVCLTLVGLLLATTLLTVSWLSDASDPEAWASAAPSPMLVVKNDITVVAVLAPLALAVASLRPRRLTRVLVIGFVASLIAVIGVVRSRTALLTTLVAIAAFALLSRGPRPTRPLRRVPLLLTGGLIGVLATVFAVDALAGLGLTHKIMHDWQGSGRLALWASAFAMFRDAPLLGHGPNSFGLHYRAYLDALALPAWIHVDPRVTPWAHNLYLELLAEQGVIGLGTFGALGAMGLSMIKRIRKSPPGDLRGLGAAAGAAFIAWLAAASFELSFIRAWVTLVFFTLLGLLTILTRSAKEAGTCQAP